MAKAPKRLARAAATESSAAASPRASPPTSQPLPREVTEAWADGAPATKAFLEPGPDDPVYRTPKEVTLELFKAFTAGIELVRDQKLAKPLGAAPDEAKPRLAAFWRSRLAFANMAGNLEGVRTLFAQGGLAQIVKQDSPGVENSILFDLHHAVTVLRGIALPADEAFRDSATRGKLEALRVSLKSARDTAGEIIARAAGLSFGSRRCCGVRLPVPRARGRDAAIDRLPPPWRRAGHCAGARRDAIEPAQLYRLGHRGSERRHRRCIGAEGRAGHLSGRRR
jgi:predicted lipoprotein